VIDTVDQLVWFFWPVTFALLLTGTVYRLARRRAWGAAALAVASAALPIVPLVVAIPVACGDDSTSLDLRSRRWGWAFSASSPGSPSWPGSTARQSPTGGRC
jgi:hypothetical protein